MDWQGCKKEWLCKSRWQYEWYEILGVMDDGAQIYSEKVIVAADGPSEAVERTKKALCRCSDEVFHTTKCSPLNQNKV